MKLDWWEYSDIIDQALKCGINRNNNKKNSNAYKNAEIWLEGYIYANRNHLTIEDIKCLYNTLRIKQYFN